MLINLAEILDIILGEYLSEAKDGNSSDEYLYTLINEILTDKEVQVSDIYVIKQEIDEWLKARKWFFLNSNKSLSINNVMFWRIVCLITI